MLQMPPVVPVRKEIDAVISRDPELTGWDKSKYVFTDITFGKTDRVSQYPSQLWRTSCRKYESEFVLSDPLTLT